jgi:uncharacterized lipoprotein YddW (UPF0748 family)
MTVTAALLIILAVAAPTMAALEIIMTQRQAVFSGTWTLANSAANKYSSEYRYIAVSTTGTAYSQWTPNIPVTASDWQVYVWYPTITSQTTSAQYVVQRAGGTNTVTKNQTTSRGTWVLLGTYTMNAGTDNYVRVTNVGSSGNAAADAVRFYSATSTDTTPPTISAVASTPSMSSAVISWTTDEYSTSQVEYGPTGSYGSQTTLDPARVTSHFVTVTGLSSSSTYHFRVKSKDAGSNTATSTDYTLVTTAVTPELRGAWMYTWGDSVLSASQITSAVDTTYAANYNMVIPEIRKAGDAYYNSNPLPCPACGSTHQEPRASNIIDPLPFDPLQDIIDKAHAKDMEVCAWIVTYRIWSTGFGTAPSSHVWAAHQNWAMKTSSGGIAEGSNYNLDPGVPAVQDYICKVVVDFASNYDIDALNFDYVRYPGTTWGYNDITEQRFYDEYGYNPPTSISDPNWGTWCEYRRQQVTDLVKKCYLEVAWRKPLIKMEADTVGWTQGNPNVDYTQTRQYSEVFQNAKAWMEEGIIDCNRLMNYKRDYDSVQGADFRVWNTWLGTMQATTGRHSVSGPGVYLNYTADSMIQLGQARSQGLAGLCTYAYHATNVGGDSNTYFYDTLQGQLFQEKAPIPDMPWKTAPTTGIIFGTVTDASKPNDPIYLNWMYKATVQVTGPVTRSTLTDATGTYGFLKLPPGTYTITVSKSGFMTRSYTNQKVNAGDVVREDFDIGYTTCSSVVGAVNTGYTLFSLPLDPVDPDPTVVLPGIRLDGNLYRWESASQSQFMYDDWAPSVFGNLNTNEGYWLIATSPYTISYQAYGGNAAMRDISLPSAGWAMVGCPFLKTAKWEDILVTNGGTTVSMQTAAKTNNWLNSTGYWYNSSDQSQYDIGLPEDWPNTTEMQTWHGYWVNSYVNDLTLTLRQAKE